MDLAASEGTSSFSLSCSGGWQSKLRSARPNHILTQGCRSPSLPSAPSHPTFQRPAAWPRGHSALLLGRHHPPPHLPPEDTAGVSGAHVDDPGSSPWSQSPAATPCQIRGQLQVPGSCTSGPAFILPGLTEFSGPLFPRTREAWTLQEPGHRRQRGRRAGSLSCRPEGETWVWWSLGVRRGREMDQHKFSGFPRLFAGKAIPSATSFPRGQ